MWTPVLKRIFIKKRGKYHKSGAKSLKFNGWDLFIF